MLTLKNYIVVGGSWGQSLVKISIRYNWGYKRDKNDRQGSMEQISEAPHEQKSSDRG